LDIEEKRSCILRWIENLPSQEDAATYYDVVVREGYEPSDELSVKRKLLEEHLEAMHTVGLLARDGKPYAAGYFRNMAYSLGTCSDILYGVTVLYQTM
jgi:cytochrome c556